MDKFRLVVPVDQTSGADNAQTTNEKWIGRSKSWIMDARELGNYMDQFRNDPTTGNRFYVERIKE